MEKNRQHQRTFFKVKFMIIFFGILIAFFDSDVPLEDLEKIDEVISSVISGQVDIPVESESSTRQRYHQSRLSYTEQHNVICDSSFYSIKSR